MARTADLLAEYRRRRDFSKTGEPSGGKKGRGKSAPVFVVQKHDATRLHYDFRFEYEGVLKSWAVTRGPSLDPADKRLAVRTEDHPLDYATFEGTIPQDQYGGGTVMLWDFGTWEPIEDVAQGFETGKLKLRLFGARMKGGWALVRMRPKKGEKRENWLLIKERDEEATGEKLTEREMVSVASGRKMEEIAAGKPTARGKAGLPAYRAPQLAQLTDRVPAGRDWLFEMKYDGYRCLAALAGETVKLFTRNGKDWTDRFGALPEAFSGLTGGTALIDGEICALEPDGRTSFSLLKQRLSEGGALVFFAFDLLERDGESLEALPLAERKEALEALIGTPGREAPIQLSTHIKGNGEAVFEAACEAGIEGVIAKRANAPYRGGRGRDWLKIKCTPRQEFIVVGWSPSDKRRGVFASLLLATEEEGELVYRGRVGTGFSDDDRAGLQARLEKLARKTAPLSGVPAAMARGARWVSPKLLAEIAYTERTGDGLLRHPSFLGLREDKPAKGVALESAPKLMGGGVHGPAAVALSEEAGVAAAKAHGIRFSSPGKVLFPGQGVTKGTLAAYYAAVETAMVPLVAGRPLSLVRCPAGRARQCFFQKHDTGGFAEAMKRVTIADKSGTEGDYFHIEDAGGLIAGVQMGVLEFHIWGALADDPEKPDRLVFDIDPDEGIGFDEVRRAAFDIAGELDTLGIESHAMVTGGKGVHVIAPIARRAGWDRVKRFASGFARAMAAREPERFTATMSKAKRRGKIFIDYLRNERGATAVAPFSTRARDGAPVAMPVSWAELETLDRANGFSLEEAVERAGGPSPWVDYGKGAKAVTEKMVASVRG